MLFIPLLEIRSSVSIPADTKASVLNQKQQRKKSFINSLNATSIQKKKKKKNFLNMYFKKWIWQDSIYSKAQIVTEFTL